GGEARTRGRIGHERRGYVREQARAADAVVEGDGLDGVVGGTVDVPDVVRHRDVRSTERIEGDEKERRVSRSRSWKGDGWIRDAVELRYAPRGERIGIGPIGVHVHGGARPVREQRLRVDAGRRRDVVPPVPD